MAAYCQANDEEETLIPKLVVRGEATVFKPADQMELTVGVVTQDADSKKAVKDNNEKMRQVLANLNTVGLDQQEYQTGRFRVIPIYRSVDDKSPTGPTISHYEVSNTIHIKTQKLDLAEKIIGAVVQAGSNRIEQINFNINNPQTYRSEVIHLATKNAISDAQALADAAQVSLIRVLSLSLDQAQSHPPMPMMLAKMANADMSYDVPIEAGQVEIHAAVNVIFEIGPVNSNDKVKMK